MSEPFIDYYKSHGISPVDQDVSDLQKHYQRRAFLYRQMGIVPSSIRGRTVLELGPGSGHNSLYTCSLGPSSYLLVDGNPTGIEKTTSLLTSHFPGRPRFRVVQSRIQEFTINSRFDFVICEGVIPGQVAPRPFLDHVASFVDVGGVLLISTADAVSTFSENVRNVIGALAVDPALDFERRLQLLEEVFSPHLQSLPEMSRSPRDWVLDNILHPLVHRGNLLSIADAVDTLDHSFDIHHSSPHFICNWRWYKEAGRALADYNSWAKDSYWRYVHNFIDHRFDAGAIPVEMNRHLLGICDETRKLCIAVEQSRSCSLIRDLVEYIKEARLLIVEVFPETAAALAELEDALQRYVDTGNLPTLVAFARLFGRGQQYVSFIRRC